jgi:signal transduction histidine kinase
VIEAKLIKDLLEVSSLLSGKLQLKSQLVDLVSLTQTVIMTFREAAEAKGIRSIGQTLEDSAKECFSRRRSTQAGNC